MLYDDLFGYSQVGVSYSGGLEINVNSVNSQASIGSLGAVFVSEVDYSNSSTIGLVSMDYASSSLIIIETTQVAPTATVYIEYPNTSKTAYVEYLN